MSAAFEVYLIIYFLLNWIGIVVSITNYIRFFLHEQIWMYMTCSIYQMVTNGIYIEIYSYITTLYWVGLNFMFYIITYCINWVVCRYYHVCYHSWPYTYFPLGVREVVVVDSSNHIMFLRILDKLAKGHWE
jgi:hypothetical protein